MTLGTPFYILDSSADAGNVEESEEFIDEVLNTSI